MSFPCQSSNVSEDKQIKCISSDFDKNTMYLMLISIFSPYNWRGDEGIKIMNKWQKYSTILNNTKQYKKKLITDKSKFSIQLSKPFN